MEGDKARHYLTHETREELLLGTVTEISRRYYELAAELVSEVRIIDNYENSSDAEIVGEYFMCSKRQ